LGLRSRGQAARSQVPPGKVAPRKGHLTRRDEIARDKRFGLWEGLRRRRLRGQITDTLRGEGAINLSRVVGRTRGSRVDGKSAGAGKNTAREDKYTPRGKE
jgi:hypothetical protein